MNKAPLYSRSPRRLPPAAAEAPPTPPAEPLYRTQKAVTRLRRIHPALWALAGAHNAGWMRRRRVTARGGGSAGGAAGAWSAAGGRRRGDRL